jgi:quercetin dioxygenase-like cupin family protein
MIGSMIPEAPLDETEHGRYAAGAGWFVLNLREARWFDRGLGFEPGLSGQGDFPQLGVGLSVLEPGEPMAMYHWEADQEDFLVLSGEALLIAEGEERPLRQWDLVHCPAGTNHVIVGAGEGLSVIFRVGHEAALRHGAGVEKETEDPGEAYARFPDPQPMRYREGWLPGG